MLFVTETLANHAFTLVASVGVTHHFFGDNKSKARMFKLIESSEKKKAGMVDLKRGRVEYWRKLAGVKQSAGFGKTQCTRQEVLSLQRD